MKRAIEEEEDKENDIPTVAGSLKRKGVIAKKRGTVQQAFPDIPEEPNDEVVRAQPRRMAPPLRKPSGSVPTGSTSTRKPTPVVSLPTLSHRVTQQDKDESPREEISSGAKRTLREIKPAEPTMRLPTQAEVNVPSRAPARIQAQRATIKRTVTQDNLRQVIPVKDYSNIRRRSRTFLLPHDTFVLEDPHP
jgi:hypothetical protein